MQDSLITNITNHDSLLNKVFGADAELSVVVTEKGLDAMSTPTILFSEFFNALVVLGAIFFYCTVIYKHKTIISSILNFPFSKFAEGNLRESNDMNVSKVLSLSSLFFLLSLIIGFSKISEFNLITNKSDFVVNYGILISFISFSLTALFGLFIDKTINWYTNMTDLFDELYLEKVLSCSLCGIIVLPITLLTVYPPLATLEYTKYIFYFFIISSLIYYYVKVYSFFSFKKISLLQYILYFCIVDFVPISFFYVITNRYLDI